MSVITIAREFGSGGKEIACLIAERLGYDCVDKELIVEVAREAGVSEEAVEEIDEVGESAVRRFLRELFTPSNIYSLSPEYPPIIWPYVPNSEIPAERGNLTQATILDRNEYLKILQKTIRTLARRGNVVIVGRGSQCILADHPDTLHVRIVAPLEYRIDQIMEERALDREAAEQLVREKDKQRARYIKDNYHAEWSSPTLYHLVLNAGRLSKEQMTDLVVHAVQNL